MESTLVNLDESGPAYGDHIGRAMVAALERGVTRSTLLEERNISSVQVRKKASAITAEELARKWNIGIQAAQATLAATTQKGIRAGMHPLARRYHTKQMQLRYNTLRTKLYTDTFFLTTPSVHGNTMAQLFVNDTHFTYATLMKAKSQAHLALKEFSKDIGVPTSLHCDNAPELTQGNFKKLANELGIRTSSTEPYSPWQNRAEGTIREIKKRMFRLMLHTRTPMALWEYCLRYLCHLRNMTATPTFGLNGRTPMEVLTGETPDISEFVDYSWYDWVAYFDPDIGTLDQDESPQKEKLGRWLGPSHRVGQAMCFYLLTETGKIISRSSVRRLSDDEMHMNAEARQQFESALRERSLKFRDQGATWFEHPEHYYDVYDIKEHEAVAPESQMPDAEDVDEAQFDKYLQTEVILPDGEALVQGVVKKQKLYNDGKPVGMAHPNPLLDTRIYEVQFPDGNSREYDANIIAESIYSQVNTDGLSVGVIEEILDHEKTADNAVSTGKNKSDPTGIGVGQRHTTTKGWRLLIQWKDGSTSWERLADLKNAYPVQVAEYAEANRIITEPAFVWWEPHTLKNKKRLLAKAKTRYWKRTHKYGIRLPKSVAEAYQIDKETGTTIWRDAIAKEMKNVAVAFKILGEDESVPIGYKQLECHMIFDVKIDLTRKARFVAGGHRTVEPAHLTYSSVVSRESVRLAFLIAALNDLDVCTADVGNAYLNAPPREKYYIIAGDEFGPIHKGKKVLIVRALYGLKSSGAAWRAHFAQTLVDLGFTMCRADNDVWMRPAIKPNGFKYWEYVLVYVDDLLVVSHDPPSIMLVISKRYRLKVDPTTGKQYHEPSTYLGADIGKYYFPKSPKERWTMSADRYLSNAIKNLEAQLAENGMQFKGTVKSITTPLTTGYQPELDTSQECNEEEVTMFQNLIGILRRELNLVALIFTLKYCFYHVI